MPTMSGVGNVVGTLSVVARNMPVVGRLSNDGEQENEGEAEDYGHGESK